MTCGTLRSGIPDSRCTSQWGCPWDNGSPGGGNEDRRGEELGPLDFVDGYHQLMQYRYLFLYRIYLYMFRYCRRFYTHFRW